MRAKPLKILATAALTLIALTAIVAFADIFLYDYKEDSRIFSWAWAAVWGWAEVKDGCKTGRLYDVGGAGDGGTWIVPGCKVSYGYIVRTPFGDIAYVKTKVWLFCLLDDAYAEASIMAVRDYYCPIILRS